MTQDNNFEDNEELKNELEAELENETNEEELDDDMIDDENDDEFLDGDDSKGEGEDEDEVAKLKDLLARTQADYNNFKMRSERDRQDMIFFLKNDIFKKILPRIDDLERIIKNTKEEEKSTSVYEAVVVMHKNYLKDLENLGVVAYESLGQEANPDKHEVMTQVPSETPGVIIDEFEKGYMLGDRVLRVAKVVVGA